MIHHHENEKLRKMLMIISYKVWRKNRTLFPTQELKVVHGGRWRWEWTVHGRAPRNPEWFLGGSWLSGEHSGLGSQRRTLLHVSLRTDENKRQHLVEIIPFGCLEKEKPGEPSSICETYWGTTVVWGCQNICQCSQVSMSNVSLGSAEIWIMVPQKNLWYLHIWFLQKVFMISLSVVSVWRGSSLSSDGLTVSAGLHNRNVQRLWSDTFSHSVLDEMFYGQELEFFQAPDHRTSHHDISVGLKKEEKTTNKLLKTQVKIEAATLRICSFLFHSSTLNTQSTSNSKLYFSTWVKYVNIGSPWSRPSCSWCS